MKNLYPEAFEFLRARKIELGQDFYARAEELRPIAWTVKHLNTILEVEAVQKSLVQAVADGTSFENWRKDLRKNIPTMFAQTRHYQETVFRNAMLSSYNAARWVHFRRHASWRPVLVYYAVGDNRTRPSHKALDGLMMPVDDPRWATLAPLNGHRCRCILNSLTEKQAKRRGYKGAPAELPKYIDPHGMERTAAPDKGWNQTPEFDLATLTGELRKKEQLLGLPPAVMPKFPKVIPVGPVKPVPTVAPIGISTGGAILPVDSLPNEASHPVTNAEIDQIATAILSPRALKNMERDMPRILAADMGIDEARKKALYMYTTNDGIDIINRSILNTKGDLSQIKDKNIKRFIEGIDQALEAAEKTAGTTYRKLDKSKLADNGFIAAHEVGGFVQYSNFTSTSQAPHLFNREITLIIHGKNGVDISPVSRFSKEKEILYPRHSIYEVLKVEEKEGRVKIELQEVDELPASKTIRKLSYDYTIPTTA